jgi:hypothetical protein
MLIYLDRIIMRRDIKLNKIIIILRVMNTYMKVKTVVLK